MKEQGLRLKAARQAAGYRSGREAALANGWKLSTYSAHEAGRRKMGDDDAEKYARRFNFPGANLTARWILWGDDIDAPHREHELQSLPIGPQFAPVRGIAKAGTWIEIDETMRTDFEPVPFVPTSYAGLEQFAYKIAGRQMDRRGILDGDYVICISYFSARAIPTQNDIVIVYCRDGDKIEISCRQVAVMGDAYELRPDSTDPRFKPLTLLLGQQQSGDGVHVEIVGLVIGKYTPF